MKFVEFNIQMLSRILSFMIPNTFFSSEFNWKKHLSGHSARNSWTSRLCVCVSVFPHGLCRPIIVCDTWSHCILVLDPTV